MRRVLKEIMTSIKLVNLIFDACREIGEKIYFGTDLLLQTLRGSETYQVDFFNLDELQCFGALKMVKAKQLLNAVEWLITDGYLQRIGGAKPIIYVLPNAKKRIESADLSKINALVEVVNSWNSAPVKVSTYQHKGQK